MFLVPQATLQELKNQLSKQEKVNQDANRDRLNLKQVLKRTEEECQSLKRYEDQCKKYKVKECLPCTEHVTQVAFCHVNFQRNYCKIYHFT